MSWLSRKWIMAGLGGALTLLIVLPGNEGIVFGQTAGLTLTNAKGTATSAANQATKTVSAFNLFATTGPTQVANAGLQALRYGSTATAAAILNNASAGSTAVTLQSTAYANATNVSASATAVPANGPNVVGTAFANYASGGLTLADTQATVANATAAAGGTKVVATATGLANAQATSDAKATGVPATATSVADAQNTKMAGGASTATAYVNVLAATATKATDVQATATAGVDLAATAQANAQATASAVPPTWP